ncbi:hypothetical protein ACH9DO_11425 [Kocuria sp. M1N1S27]|uniref:hypothetical protein n=1 Tax=Kocuria kalidii TaxID=3376283 RepID=UPI0037A697F5
MTNPVCSPQRDRGSPGRGLGRPGDGAASTSPDIPGTGPVTLDDSGATPNDVDLRALALPDITGLAHLRGATIDDLQLQQLAAHLGIDVAG